MAMRIGLRARPLRVSMYSAGRMFGIETAGQDAVRGELLDASREHAWGQAGKACFKVLKTPRLVQEQVAQNEDSPAVAMMSSVLAIEQRMEYFLSFHL